MVILREPGSYDGTERLAVIKLRLYRKPGTAGTTTYN